MLAGLPARIAGLNRVAEGFYRHWLSLIFPAAGAPGTTAGPLYRSFERDGCLHGREG